MSTQTLEKKPKKQQPSHHAPAQTQTQAQADNPQPTAARPSTESYLMPPVSIFENDEFLTVQADLPGVSKDRVFLQCEQGNLTLEGEISLDLNSDNSTTTAVQAELRTPRFRRSFVIGSELDTQSIKAEMADGVLTIRIPKKPSARPFKIEIS